MVTNQRCLYRDLLPLEPCFLARGHIRYVIIEVFYRATYVVAKTLRCNNPNVVELARLRSGLELSERKG